jgi:hypothetical protein
MISGWRVRNPRDCPSRVRNVGRDLFLAQRFARHVSPLTTTVYTHPSDEELQFQLRGLNC